MSVPEQSQLKGSELTLTEMVNTCLHAAHSATDKSFIIGALLWYQQARKIVDTGRLFLPFAM